MCFTEDPLGIKAICTTVRRVACGYRGPLYWFFTPPVHAAHTSAEVSTCSSREILIHFFEAQPGIILATGLLVRTDTTRDAMVHTDTTAEIRNTLWSSSRDWRVVGGQHVRAQHKIHGFEFATVVSIAPESC